MLAKSSDGFVAVFTCAELMPEMGATRAYVVWRCDGQDLPPDEGPLRLVVATDKKGSRSVRQLVEVRVADGGLGYDEQRKAAYPIAIRRANVADRRVFGYCARMKTRMATRSTAMKIRKLE